ncbi:MAG: ferredoxin [Pirellulales bacterium]
MKATVDKSLCMGCNVCIDVCPEVFEADDDNQARAKVDTVPPEHEAACRDAADQCPEAAIKIEE